MDEPKEVAKDRWWVWLVLIVVVSLLTTIITMFGRPMDAMTLVRIHRGMEGLNPGPLETLYSWTWQNLGATPTDWLFAWIGAVIAALFGLAGGKVVANWLKRTYPGKSWGWLPVLAIVCTTAWLSYAGSDWRRNPVYQASELLLPAEWSAFVGTIQGPVFSNPGARPFLEILAPEFQLPPEESAPEALRKPAIFRQIDRENRFTAVALLGPWADYENLLKHLQESPDWRLAYLDHWGVVFRRDGGRNWEAPQPESIGKNLSPTTAGILQAQWGMMLEGAGYTRAADQFYEAARRNAPDSPEVLVQIAQSHALRRNWVEARAVAEQAHQIAPQSPSVLQTYARALLETGASEKAWLMTTEIMEITPDEPQALFLHARTCNAVKAYGEEVKCLEKLIQMTEKAGGSATGYRVYLGQAYARLGKAKEALAELEQAAQSGELPDTQQKSVDEMIQNIRQVSAL